MKSSPVRLTFDPAHGVDEQWRGVVARQPAVGGAQLLQRVQVAGWVIGNRHLPNENAPAEVHTNQTWHTRAVIHRRSSEPRGHLFTEGEAPTQKVLELHGVDTLFPVG